MSGSNTLPVPVGRQREVLCLPAKGHFVVLGTAGSGKTTLAILRAAYLADPRTDHAWRTLLVTFNRALVTYLEHLQGGTIPNVEVRNYHRFARGYLRNRGIDLDNAIVDRERKGLIAEAVKGVALRHPHNAFFDRHPELFSEEIKWMAQHGLLTLEDYEAVERVGRAQERITRANRGLMFEVRGEYRELRARQGKSYDWDDLASAVLEQFRLDSSERYYRHVVIDEGQDFSPEMIRSLVEAVPHAGSITFFGDVAQQIYGHRMSWREAGLQVADVWKFCDNYRNTKQIARLGLAISNMPHFIDPTDIVEPVAPAADGALPTLVSCRSTAAELDLAVSQANSVSKTLSVAILLRDRHDEWLIQQRLPKASIRLHRDMNMWQSGPGIRYGTYHAAKGLEFDMVIMPFCSADRLPDPGDVTALGIEDASIRDGRLVYVGVTRARSWLILTYTGEPTTLLPPDARLYQRITR